ncbi:conserved hypothetical protein [Rhodospirillaceae bacterium LM-1]|nr:conserved hypothetical protein [Rhodospirillaceae bacterium LM-1]
MNASPNAPLLPFARQALAEIPKLLLLLDRNPMSPSHGCFDRNYWLYRLTDFPSGMAQEFVWPLALAWDADLPDNPYYRNVQIKEWVWAGIRFAAASAHADGSSDDFFPFERAFGATAFALLAGIEAAKLTGLKDPSIWDFFKRRGRWLALHQESGRLSNHEALGVLCLYLLFLETGESGFETAALARLERVLSWQHAEGWFWEYEGCDLGYQTLTLSLLARLLELRPDPRLEEALMRCSQMTAQFLHPDGSFGGEYSSRNTLNYFPLAFELLGRRDPALLAVNDAVAAAFAKGQAPSYSDDHMIGHHLWNYLLAWRHAVPDRPKTEPHLLARGHWPGAGLLTDRRNGGELFVALNKGGVFKLYKNGLLALSDTHLSVEFCDGRVAVAHMIDDYQTELGLDRIVIQGKLGYAKQKLMKPFDNLLLRGFMFCLGRFFPDLVRRLLQGVLITGKKPAPARFRRVFERASPGWKITDQLWAENWRDVKRVGIGGHQTSIFVIQSRTYHPSQLQGGWLDLTARLDGLAPGDALTLERQP